MTLCECRGGEMVVFGFVFVVLFFEEGEGSKKICAN